MATTRIIAMHQNKGKSIADCVTDRLNYAINGDKTRDGELVTAYACSPYHPEQQFMLSKKLYHEKTGRKQKNSIISYQVRQSFHPDDKLTPEEVNKIGCEFAERFLKGKHAYIVATHVNTNCYHNHVYVKLI